MGMLEEQWRKDKDPDLDVDDDARLLYDREKHWKDMLEENIKDKGKARVLRWEVYKKEK